MMLGCKGLSVNFFDDVYFLLWTSNFSMHLLPADI